MTKSDSEIVNRIISHKQFEAIAKSSSIWMYDALRLFRASQVLCQTAKNAQDEYLQIILNRYNLCEKTEVPKLEQQTLEEHILVIDSSLIRLAYFCLSRSIELLLKAILIERQVDYFFTTREDGKMFSNVEKLNHKIISYIKECSIELPEKENIQIELLQDLVIWGTFPIPKSEEDLYKAYIQQSKAFNPEDKKDYRLTIENYADISLIFDKFLDILNGDRSRNGKTIWKNVFR